MKTLRKQRGFTLLEVMIALVLLSTVAILAVRVSGDSQRELAESSWYDEVARLGRNKMIVLLQQRKGSALNQWGTLAPELPEVQWRAKMYGLQCREGQRLEFLLVQELRSGKRELVLEYVFPR